jgi:hypothetical protein
MRFAFDVQHAEEIAAHTKKVESLLHIEFLLSGTLIVFGFSGVVEGPV